MEPFTVKSAAGTVEHTVKPVRIPKREGEFGLVRIEEFDYFLTRTKNGFKFEKVDNKQGEIIATYLVELRLQHTPDGFIVEGGVCQCGDWEYRGGRMGKRCKHLAVGEELLSREIAGMACTKLPAPMMAPPAGPVPKAQQDPLAELAREAARRAAFDRELGDAFPPLPGEDYYP